MSDTTEHGELGEFAQRKSLTHPRKEMGQTIVTSPDPFGDTGAASCEGQSTDTIRSEDDIRVSFRKVVA